MKKNIHAENDSIDCANIEAVIAKEITRPTKNATYQGVYGELNRLDELFTPSLSHGTNNNPFHLSPEMQASNLIKQKKTSKLKYFSVLIIVFMFALILL